MMIQILPLTSLKVCVVFDLFVSFLMLFHKRLRLLVVPEGHNALVN